MNIVSSTSPDRPAGNVAMKAMSLPKPLVAGGRQLIDAELLHGQRGEYGKQVVADLARQLTADFGKGWSEQHLRHVKARRGNP